MGGAWRTHAHGNETRFINDFRGIAPAPNVAFVEYHHHVTGELAVAVVSLRLLRPGEEILVSYGRKYDLSSDMPDLSEGSEPVDAKVK